MRQRFNYEYILGEAIRRLDLECGCCVVCNRYVSSNLAHGGAKYRSLEEAIAFIGKVEYLEYMVHRLPRPNLEFFLDVPTEKARMLASTRAEREYLGGKGLDLAEADLSHQEKAVMMYRWLCENRPNFARIECTTLGWDMLAPEEINDLMWEQIVWRGWVS